MQQDNDENWMPLESNPEVINSFIQKMGLKTDQFSFQEMLSTEEWALEMIPKPVLGVLFLFEVTPVQSQHKNNQEQNLHPENVPQDLFFMKQYAQNACGTIGLFHIVLNALKNYPDLVEQNSYLWNFRNQVEGKNADEKGKIFKENKSILQEHKDASSEGQSECKQSCDSHFIAFIQRDGRLYELDGFKICPVDHGPCAEDEILTKSSQVIQQFMQRDPDNIQFSMQVLAKNPEE